jgi:Ca2+/Na+ antiporter
VARHPSDLPHYRRFGYFYLGALLVVLPAFLLFGNAQHLPSTDVQWLVLLFLGCARPRWACTGGTRAPAWFPAARWR